MRRELSGGHRLGQVLLAMALLGPGCGRVAVPPSVLLVTLDTTRADHLGCYGYARPTTPELDRLCADAVVHTAAYSTSSWTLPAHASLFTGRFPTSHGARYDPAGELVLGDALRGRWADGYRAGALSPDRPTLAEAFEAAGYATAGVVAGPWMLRLFGLARGFGHWDDADAARYRGRPGREVSDRALAWLEQHGDRPFFLFLNYFDPHAPFQPPPEFLALFTDLDAVAREGAPSRQEVQARYDAEIRYMDAQLGRVLEALRERGLYERMWVVVTADHGELFGEHGLERHGSSLYEPEIRVPLIVKRPGPRGAGSRSDAAIQLTDLPGLILGGAGVPLPEGMPAAARPDARRPILAEVHPLPDSPRAGDWYAIVLDGYKLVRRAGGPRELYHIARDPGEEHDLIGEDAARAARLEAALDAWLRTQGPPAERPPPRAIDEETRHVLEALGYLESE